MPTKYPVRTEIIHTYTIELILTLVPTMLCEHEPSVPFDDVVKTPSDSKHWTVWSTELLLLLLLFLSRLTVAVMLPPPNGLFVIRSIQKGSLSGNR